MDLRSVLTGTKPYHASENLLNPVKIEKSAGFYKSVIVDALSVFSAGFFGYAYYRYLTGGSVWLLFGMLALFAVLSALQVFLSKSNGRRLFVILLETIAL